MLAKSTLKEPANNSRQQMVLLVHFVTKPLPRLQASDQGGGGVQIFQTIMMHYQPFGKLVHTQLVSW